MKEIRVEESQAVTIELRKLGILAFSNDIIDCSGGHHEWHIKKPLEEIINNDWDAIIAFPPCTHLAVSGAKHFEKKRLDGRQEKAIRFFMMIANANCKFIAIENPVNIIGGEYILEHFPKLSAEFNLPYKKTQVIQPWQFGDPFQKTTCLWLENLPNLNHTNIVDKGDFYISPSGKKLPKWYSDNKSGKIRSKTFPGIASAMASQWGKYLINYFEGNFNEN